MVSHKEMVRRAEEGVKEAFNEAVKRGNAPKDAGKAELAWFDVNERMGYGSLCVRTDEDRVFCTAFTQSLYEDGKEL